MHSAGDQLTYYRLVERLGETHREIWQAVDTRDERAVSIKVLPHLADPECACLRIEPRVNRDGIRFTTEPVESFNVAGCFDPPNS